MEDTRFDTLTRALATGTTRRTVLRRLAGGLLAGTASLSVGRDALADHQPDHCAHEGQKEHLNQNHPKSCCPGLTPDATGRCQASAGGPVIVTGSLDETDPVFFGGCLGGINRPYDAHTFTHGGGALSLAVRGQSSGGGTLADPVVLLYAGGSVPSDGCGRVANNDEGGCGNDAYLETTQPAGTYTAMVFGVSGTLGTYTVEVNTFTGPEFCG